jgi:UDP-N-acetylmuramate--alanine ligase
VPVSGCEARESITVAGLRALGGDIVIGHSPRHLDDTDTFVFTTAINPRHEEDPTSQQAVTLTPHDTLIHRP